MTNRPTWNERSCPNCGEFIQKKLEVSSTQKAEELSFVEVRDYFIGIRKEQLFFSYYRCLKCNLLYCPYYFTNEQLDLLYSDMPDNLLGAEKATAERTQVGYFNWFNKYVKKANKYLELGPDIGLVTGEVIERLEPGITFLIEPNMAMHQQLQSLSKKNNKIRIYRELELLDASDIDLAIGIHVFDHLIEPLAQLVEINSQTSDGGYIGIVVHNEASTLRRFLGKKWPPFCLQHPQLFNRESLTGMLQKAGFEYVSISRSTNHFRINHIGALAIDVFGLPKFLKKVLPNWEVPISLGNQISIFRKPVSK
jgi:hypothetical protein